MRIFNKNTVILLLLNLLQVSSAMAKVDTTKDPVIGHAPEITSVVFDHMIPVAGDVITATVVATDPDGDTILPLEYQWMLNGQNINGATSSSYLIKSTDAGEKLSLVIKSSTDENLTEPSQTVFTSDKLQVFTVQSMPIASTLSVKNMEFTIKSGFPSTGYLGAEFYVQINGTRNQNRDYVWHSDQPWVVVDNNGKIRFESAPTSGTNSVTITATSNSGGRILTWSFTVDKWFVVAANDSDWLTGKSLCLGKGMRMSLISELTNASPFTDGSQGVGGLFSEWGISDFKPNKNNAIYWVEDTVPNSNNYVTVINSLGSGITGEHSGVSDMRSKGFSICVLTL